MWPLSAQARRACARPRPTRAARARRTRCRSGRRSAPGSPAIRVRIASVPSRSSRSRSSASAPSAASSARELGDVLARVAVLGRLGAAHPGGDRLGEQPHLGAGVVEVVLALDLVAAGLEQRARASRRRRRPRPLAAVTGPVGLALTNSTRTRSGDSAALAPSRSPAASSSATASRCQRSERKTLRKPGPATSIRSALAAEDPVELGPQALGDLARRRARAPGRAASRRWSSSRRARAWAGARGSACRPPRRRSPPWRRRTAARSSASGSDAGGRCHAPDTRATGPAVTKLAPMRALVTGGAGFIGSHVVDALVARGDEVLVFDDLSSGRRENLAGRARRRRRAWSRPSVTDAAAVAAPFARLRPQLVCHLAAQIDVRRSVADPVYDLGVNVGGTINLLEGSRTTGGRALRLRLHRRRDLRRGRRPRAAARRERRVPPDAPYGQSKLAAEGYLALYRRLYGLEAIALRLGQRLRPAPGPARRGAAWSRSSPPPCSAGSRPSVFGDGEQTRDYVYVGDVAAAFLAAAEAGGEGAYNIGTGTRDERQRARPPDRGGGRRRVRPRARAAAARRGPADRDRPGARRARARLARRAHGLDRGLELTVALVSSLSARRRG